MSSSRLPVRCSVSPVLGCSYSSGDADTSADDRLIIDVDDSVFSDISEESSSDVSLFPGPPRKSDHANMSTPVRQCPDSDSSSSVRTTPPSNLIFSRESPVSDQECQDILDSHIKSTLDQVKDNDPVECLRAYRPVKQEPYDNFALPTTPPVFREMKRKLSCITNKPEVLSASRRRLAAVSQHQDVFSKCSESDSGYSGSPSPDTSLPPPPPYSAAATTTTRQSHSTMSALAHSISEEYVPNVPSHFFMPEHTSTNHDFMFGSRLYSNTNLHINYIPPIWGHLHNLRDEMVQGLSVKYEDEATHDFEPQVVPDSVHAHPHSSLQSLEDYHSDFLTYTTPQVSDPPHMPTLTRGDQQYKLITRQAPPTISPQDIDQDSTVSELTNSAKSLKNSMPMWRMQCKDCKKRFNSLVNLENHIDSTHKGIRPFKCEVCNKTFAQRATLRTHARVHTGEKPYKCNICDRKFADLSTCKKHQRVHDGQKPYECDVCGKRFSQSGNMLRHREGHDRKESRINITTITSIPTTLDLRPHYVANGH